MGSLSVVVGAGPGKMVAMMWMRPSAWRTAIHRQAFSSPSVAMPVG
ncbi:hypothetical protein ACFW17_23345 [Streptomyces sp. NPDC058961]